MLRRLLREAEGRTAVIMKVFKTLSDMACWEGLLLYLTTIPAAPHRMLGPGGGSETTEVKRMTALAAQFDNDHLLEIEQNVSPGNAISGDRGARDGLVVPEGDGDPTPSEPTGKRIGRGWSRAPRISVMIALGEMFPVPAQSPRSSSNLADRHWVSRT